MKKLGLIGHPVGHSKSPDFFKTKLASINRSDVTYDAYDLESVEYFRDFVASKQALVGLNVTIPHKESIIKHLCCLDDVASEIGAVNTIVKTENGWKGYNTDTWGFSRSLKPFIKGRHERAIICGTGGASKAVVHSLKKLGIKTVVVSRNPEGDQVGYSELTPEAMGHYLLIVNCTPLGTSPDVEGCVLSLIHI